MTSIVTLRRKWAPTRTFLLSILIVFISLVHCGFSDEEIDLLLVNHRGGELEQCGCQLRPRGGVHREAALLESWSKELPSGAVRLSGGTTFVPANYKNSEQKLYQQKATFLVDALNRLKTSAIALSTRDMELGVASLRDLQKKADFPFLSGNLTTQSGEPLFKEAWEIPKSGGVWVTALSYGKAPHDVKVGDPEVTLRKVIKEYAPKALIVLSDLPEKQIVRATHATKIPALWFGADKEGPFKLPVFLSEHAFAVNPEHQGRSVTWVVMGKPKAEIPPTAFYNEERAKRALEEREAALGALARATESVKKAMKKDRASHLAEKKKWETEVAELEPVPVQQVPGSLTLYWQTVPLLTEPQKPNALSQVIEKYKAHVRQDALK